MRTLRDSRSLHRTTGGVKLDRTIVISGELTHGNQVLNKARKLLREKGLGSDVVPVEVTCKRDPLPTTMDEGYCAKKECETDEGSEVM
jgi:hypothetical protein